ncbi:formimidoylglutamate deiminase [Arthrobacter sp. Br18]|uniref:formimidoylglutamate deiminase n=1 Tax=Arthrobacter sp. Br18 TaxID=1312954 RepID=UPI0004B378E1|nr:formimidoylglutamate deiminase [Arthrobacter sp. Br18]
MTPAGVAVWCEYAWLGAEGVCDSVRIEVDASGIVASVLPGVRAQYGDLLLDGVVFPAAANAHSHTFHRVLRGRTHDGLGSFWSWREKMYRAADALTPDNYEEFATAVYAEMVVAGWSSVAEFHYVHHQPDGRAYDGADRHAVELALGRAAVRAGIRLTLLDTCYLAGGFGEPPGSSQQRFADPDASAWLARLADLRRTFATTFHPDQVSVGAAIHSVRAVPEEALAVIARKLPADLPLHIHLSEQPAENEDCLRSTGLTPTGLLARHGLLTDRLSVVHATHLTAEDIRLLGDAGVSVVLCPTTEADLADGIGPAHELAAAGCRLALGTDQHAVIDPWLEMRALEYGERLKSGRRGSFTPEFLHSIASEGGASSQGRPGPGIHPGSACDLMAVDQRSTRTAGSHWGQLVFSATAQDVTAVVVGGHLVARHGVHETLGNPAGLLSSAIARLDAAATAQNPAGEPGHRFTHPWERS